MGEYIQLVLTYVSVFAVILSRILVEEVSAKNENGQLESQRKDEHSFKPIKIFYYSLESETNIFTNYPNEESNKTVKVKITYSINIIHQDLDGSILCLYKLDECIEGECKYTMPDLFVQYNKDTLDIMEIFVSVIGTDDIHWNPLFAAVNSLLTPVKTSGSNEQRILPIGICHYSLEKQNDGEYLRRFYDCRLEGYQNHSFIPQINAYFYEQNIYYTLSRKNADILSVKAEETLETKLTLHSEWGTRIHTVSNFEILRKETYGFRNCPNDVSTLICLESLGNVRSLGKDWREIMQNMNLALKKRLPEPKAQLKNFKMQFNANENLQEKLKIYRKFLEILPKMTSEDVSNVIRELQYNDPILPILIDIVATHIDDNTVHQNLRKIMGKESTHLTRYLYGIAMRSKIDQFFITHLENWWTVCDMGEICDQIPYTIAALYRRDCKNHWISCNEGKNEQFNAFFSKLSNCNTSECHLKALSVMQNIPFPSVLSYLEQFLCSSKIFASDVERSALDVLSLYDFSIFTEELISGLLRIFHNICVYPQSRTNQFIALEILVRIAPNHPNIGKFILSSGNTKFADEEKRAYLYDYIQYQRQINKQANNYWTTELKKSEGFRQNYFEHSEVKSNVVAFNFSVSNDKNIWIALKTEFNEGILKRSCISSDLIVDSVKSDELFGLNIRTQGFSSFFSESTEENDVDTDEGTYNTNENSVESLQAEIQFNLGPIHLSPIKVFDGMQEIMNIILNADGTPLKIFEIGQSVLLFDENVLLLSGTWARIKIGGFLLVDVEVAPTISLWNRIADIHLGTNLLLDLDELVQVVSNRDMIHNVSTIHTLGTELNLDMKAEFYEDPYNYCIIFSSGPLDISRSCETKGKRGKNSVRRTRFAERTYFLNSLMSKMCSHFDFDF